MYGLVLISSPPALRAGEPIVADLNGHPISSTEVAAYNCHDFDFPRIHCFETVAALERNAARYMAGNRVT